MRSIKSILSLVSVVLALGSSSAFAYTDCFDANNWPLFHKMSGPWIGNEMDYMLRHAQTLAMRQCRAARGYNCRIVTYGVDDRCNTLGEDGNYYCSAYARACGEF